MSAPDPLPPEAALALAWTPQNLRGRLSILLQLDRRLSRIVARTSEPMLGQMRLAWWRDMLARPTADRPRGDAVLDGLAAQWPGVEPALRELVDGWEILVASDRLGAAQVAAFAAGRAAPFILLGGDLNETMRARVEAAARCWALVDAAAGISDRDERALFLAAARQSAAPSGRLPRSLRGLAVLEALAQRSLARDGAPLMAGRGAALTAMRAAIFRA